MDRGLIYFAMRVHTDPPAIAVTAQILLGERGMLRRQGFDGYLSKPFQRADLLALFRAHLPDSSTP